MLIKFLRKKGQSILEFTALTVIILAAIMTMSAYFKRGVQGRWRSATDDIGDQYDPLGSITNITYGVTGTANTTLTVQKDGLGMTTLREDTSRSVTTKRGKTTVGSAAGAAP